MPALLLEIGCEEIPASMIAAAQKELSESIHGMLQGERLLEESSQIESFSTPRRIAVRVQGILPRQADVEEKVVGPSLKVAFKDGVPTPAAVAFAKKSGVDVKALQTVANAKGEYISATVRRQGQTAAEVLKVALRSGIAGISWPKSMYWRAGKPERFVRPVRWLVALLDEEVLPVEFAGVRADAISYGHRVLYGDHPVVIRNPQEYEAKLAVASVEVNPEARRHRIRKALDAAARQIPDARWREDEELVDIVTNLTEWPSVVLGSFETSYLELPQEILVTVMRDHQKYFAVEDGNGKLLPNFLTVLNTEVDAAGAVIIRQGNERVLRARFNDARFFWDVDQKVPLKNRVDMLKNVTFQKDLGSYYWKTERNLKTADYIVVRIFGNHFDGWDTIKRAVELAKSDLTTEMVKEFTELQGIVGGLYAREQNELYEVADAIYEQYRPQSPSDEIPATKYGAIVALADKITTIMEMFKKNMVPSGSRDPFALRRAGTGVVRIIAESPHLRERVHLVTVVHAANQYDEVDVDLRYAVLSFLLDRLEFYLQESCGIRLQIARAVRNSGAAKDNDDSSDKLVGYGHVAGFARELNEQIGSPDVLAVAESLKRIANILRQAREKTIRFPVYKSETELSEPAEIELSRKVTEVKAAIHKNYRSGNYKEVIASIATLQQPLARFFDSVMVMVDDPQVRGNRLALLAHTESVVRWAADFSELASIQGTA